MEHMSLHGLAFVALQLVVVLVLLWALSRWHAGPAAAGGERAPRRRRHGIPILVALGFVAWYLVLRTRPVARGGDAFAYTLGIFDGVSLAGLAALVLLHVLWVRNGRPSGSSKRVRAARVESASRPGS